MRPPFREQLHAYNRMAKAELEKVPADERLERVLGWQIDAYAQERAMDPSHQRRIYELQKEKRRVLRWLKTELAQLDVSKETIDPEARRVIMRGEDYFVRHPDGSEDMLTVGDILTDHEWGIRYALDAQTIPRRLRKRYLIVRAKEKLRTYLNQQIAIDQSEGAFARRGPRGKYQEYLRGTHEQLGHLAERIVRTYLQKLAINHNLDMELIEATIDQDAEFTIDFLISIRQRKRGVHVDDAPDTARELVGVQLTTAKRHPGKAKRIDEAKVRLAQTGVSEQPIRDIVLVKIMRSFIRRMMNAWNASNKPSGGPEQFLDKTSQEKMFRAILKGIYSLEEIDAQWQLISSQEMKKGDHRVFSER